MVIRACKAITAHAVAVVIALCCSVPAFGVVNGQHPACTDRRFDAVGLFLTSGPFACGGFVSGSCVLIDRDLVIMARHELDVTAYEPLPDPIARPYYVRFRRAESGLVANTSAVNGDPCHGVYQEIAITAFYDAPTPGSDMVLARLERAPKFIRPVGVELDRAVPALSNIVVAGWGWSGNCWQSGEAWGLRVGRGLIPTTAPSNALSLSFSWCTLGSAPTCQRCPPGGPWVSVNLHDSGGGVFIEVPSNNPVDPEPELRLIGVISTVQTANRPKLWNQAGGTPRLSTTPQLSVTSRGDFNRDGQRSAADIFDIVAGFASQQCISDVNQDGDINAEDVIDFLQLFFAN